MGALVLLSGGLDSTVAAMMYREAGQIALALTFDYGQRAAQAEINAAQQISKKLNCEHQIIKLQFPQVGALLNTQASMPHLQNDQLDDFAITKQSAKSVWVPNRNGVLINWAAMVAESKDIQEVIVGFNAEEAVAFPDNGKSFVDAINQSLSYSTANQVKVISPTINLNKKQIVQVGKKLQAPFDLLWSCYEAGPTPCKICESCLRLKRALG